MHDRYKNIGDITRSQTHFDHKLSIYLQILTTYAVCYPKEKKTTICAIIWRFSEEKKTL